MRKVILFVTVLSIALACSTQSADNAKTEVNKTAVATTSAELEIRGMTCEVGCKKLIEKNIRKMAGVTKFEIDFKHNSAYLEYDSSITDAEKVKEMINSINNGTYSATVLDVSKL
ncbi:MAG: heavy-metal-associated domain-containing protein [Thermaurantimonas sp.]|uniref:heavy-metal-associated domain-containing protein n=1 Tax=Thermaurantimonas sp. TaxID=2681568 RepID=UPI00391A263D